MSIEDFRSAATARDVRLALDACADDVVLRSPLTDRMRFTGKDEVGRLFETVYANFAELEYHTEIGEGDRRVLVGRAVVGGQRVEETLLLTLNGAGKIAEITLFMRPLPGLTAVMGVLGPKLARSNGRSRLVAGLLRVLTAPLVFATRSGDRMGIQLAMPRRSTSD